MKENKALVLLRTLSRKELAAFKSVMKNVKRKGTLKLLEILENYISGKKKFNIDVVYDSLYGEPYSTKKGYLIRNEMRLLTKALTSFIVQNELEKERENDPDWEQSIYLKAIYERGAIHLFENENRKALDKALEKNYFRVAADLIDPEIELFTTKRAPTIANIKHLASLLDKRRALLTKAYLTELADIEYKKAFTQRTILALGGISEVEPLENIHLDWDEECETNALVEFKLLHKKAFGLTGKSKIETLQAALTVFPKISSPHFASDEWLAGTYHRIAMEYFLMGDNDTSRVFYLKAFQYRDGLPSEKLAPFIFNFMTNELRAEKFDEALKIIDENEDALIGNDRTRDRTLCMKAICSIFLGEFEKAESCIPDQRKGGGLQTYFYMRIIQIIIYFTRNEHELALTETENVMQSVYYNKDLSFRNFTNELHYFLRIQLNSISSSNYKILKASRLSELKELGNWGMNQHTLLYRWLINEYQKP
ncbi:MAG: hypothetical protein AAF502_03780 [Bacteroidota bacterium]